MSGSLGFGSFGPALGPWTSFGSFGQRRRVHFVIVGFIRVRPGGHRVHSVGCSVHSGAFWESSESFGFIGFIRVCPGGRRVHSRVPCVSMGSFGSGHGVISFIFVRWFHLGASCWSLRSILVLFRRALGSFEFFRARCCMHSGWLRLFGRALGVVGFLRGSLGSFSHAMGVFGFIWVCGFIPARP